MKTPRLSNFSFRVLAVRLFAFAAAAGVFAASARAQTTVASPPAGYFAFDIKGGSDNYISLPLFHSPERYARITGIQADRITCGGTAFEASAYQRSDGSPRGVYVEFISGALEGVFYQIVGNSADTLVLDTQGQDLRAHPLGPIALGEGICIRPAWTLAEVFGSDSSDLVLELQPNIALLKDSVLLFDQARIGINKAPNQEFAYIQGKGWRRRGNSTADTADYPLRPGEPLIVRRRNSNSLRFEIFGSALTTRAVVLIRGGTPDKENDTYVALMHPETLSLNDANLYNAADPATGVIRESAKSFLLTDRVLAWEPGRTGLNQAPDQQIYYLAGAGWRQIGSSSTTVGDTVKIEPGRAYIIRKGRGSSARHWIQIPSHNSSPQP